MLETDKDPFKDLLDPKAKKAQETLIGLLWEESGRTALRKMFNDNPLLLDFFISSEPITLSEDFILSTSAFADSEEEEKLYEILATKDGRLTLEAMLKMDAQLVEQLDLNTRKHTAEDDQSPFSNPWL